MRGEHWSKPRKTMEPIEEQQLMVRRGGLEPPRSYPLAPQASASANSAISASRRTIYYFFGLPFCAGVSFCCPEFF